MGYMLDVATEIKTPTFTFELDRLASRLSRIDKISLEIEARLARISGPSTNIRDAATDRKKTPVDLTVIEKLRNASDQLDEILDRLDDSKLTLTGLV